MIPDSNPTTEPTKGVSVWVDAVPFVFSGETWVTAWDDERARLRHARKPLPAREGFCSVDATWLEMPSPPLPGEWILRP
jgi:hypothetical protein